MSKNTGKRAASAISDFNAQNAGERLRHLAKTLNSRPFGAKHVSQARALLTEILSAATIKVFESFSPGDTASRSRKLSLDLIYMSVAGSGARDDRTADSNFIPVALTFKMSPDELSLYGRSLPVMIESDHTEFRFIKRTGNALEYKSDEFRITLVYALALASFTSLLLADKKPVPVAIPHPHGLFLGYANPADPEAFLPNIALRVKRDPESGTVTSNGLNGPAPQPSWAPPAALTLRTFVGLRDLSDTQRTLHRRFTDLLGDPMIVEAIEFVFRLYLTGDEQVTPAQRIAVTTLKNALADITSSEEWQREIAMGMSHLPGVERNLE